MTTTAPTNVLIVEWTRQEGTALYERLPAFFQPQLAMREIRQQAIVPASRNLSGRERLVANLSRHSRGTSPQRIAPFRPNLLLLIVLESRPQAGKPLRFRQHVARPLQGSAQATSLALARALDAHRQCTRIAEHLYGLAHQSPSWCSR